MHVLLRIERPLVTALAVALLAAFAPARAMAQAPRLGLYAMVFDTGQPLYTSAGAMDPVVFDEFSRFHELIIEPTAFTPYRPEALQLLRSLNPDIRLVAYVTGHYTWYAAAADSFVHFPTRYWRTVRDLNGFLYNTDGQRFGERTNQFGNVNIAKRDAGGHYVVAEALAALFYDAVMSGGQWDGLFLDTFCDDILWEQSAGETIDYARAGYPDLASFAAGWRAGTDTLASRLRGRCGPSAILIGNCGQGTKYVWFNGWMRENFPYQNGGTWFSNMYNDPGGYFVDDARFRRPTHDFIFSAVSGTVPTSADNSRRVRFGLGSATLGEGFHCFGPPDRGTRSSDFYGWWYDEYAVDLATGRSVTDGRSTGWLGAPLDAAYQMIWLSAGPDAVSNTSFETDVSSDWRFFTAVGSTVSHDTTNHALGSASARVDVPSASAAVPWNTSFTTTGTLNLFTGLSCSATFWARASVPRSVRVAAGRVTGGGEFASRGLDLTTEWQRYQVVLTPAATGPGTLQFHLAGATGTVWLDDVHFQTGVNSIYRRDFTNGIVLVNPGASAQTVVLERPFRRILGSVDPSVNDGLESATIQVPAMDARFLIGSDFTPPADVRDLHVVPPAPGTPR